MDERRTLMRERVIYGATVGAISGSSRPCVVRNFSDAGAQIVFGNETYIPDDIALTIARKGRSYRARVVWWRDNTAGVAFTADAPSIAVVDTDLQKRLRISERNTRHLKRRVRELLGEG